jgi:formamidase
MTTTLINVSRILLSAFCFVVLCSPALANQSATVVIKRIGANCAADPNCFNRMHHGIEMKVRAKPGQQIAFQTRNTADQDLADTAPPAEQGPPGSRVHPITGPVHIEGAKSGDVLAVTIVAVEPGEFGFTILHPIGFISDLFPGVYKEIRWTLGPETAVSDELPGVEIPIAAFPGIVTVLPGAQQTETIMNREAALLSAGGAAPPPEPINAVPEALCGPNAPHPEQCLRTFPPREHGGNLDIRYLGEGATLYLPCYQDGCGLAIGDVHYAQGDGEVSGTAIEMDSTVIVNTKIMKPGSTNGGVHFAGPASLLDIPSKSFYATTGFPFKQAGDIPPDMVYLESEKLRELTNLSKDISLAARNALVAMLDYLTATRGLTREQAYILASVAVDLRIGQVVDAPNVVVSAILPLDIFVEQQP